jgi:hypothetical protein
MRRITSLMYYLIGSYSIVALMVGTIAYGTRGSACSMESVAAGVAWPMVVAGYANTYDSLIGAGRIMCVEAQAVAVQRPREWLVGNPY